MASPRQLAYRDRFVWLLEQTVSAQWDDCNDFVDRYVFPDMDTRVPLVLYLSQQEWTTLYTAVLTGADLSYPDTSQDVEYLFLQSVICSMNQFCAAMIDCLMNDPDVWAALQQLLSDNGYTGGVGDPNAPMADDILGGNLLPAGYTCTDDKAFGMALAVVNSINHATTEVLQAIEVLTNPVEIASELGDNIPGIGALATATDIARWIQDTAQEEYELAWSTTVRDELACLLWCDFKGDCYLSMDTIFDIYLSESGATPPAGVLLTDWLAWLILLPFTGALSTVATVSLLGLLAIRYGGSFGDFALGIQSMETVINLAQDDSSSDWSIVCDPCTTTWCYEWFNGSDDDAVAEDVNGCTAVVTTELVTGCCGQAGTAQWIFIRITLPSTTNITSLEFQTDMNAVRVSSTDKCQIKFDGTQVYNINTPQGVFTHSNSGVWNNVDEIIINCWAACDDVGASPGPDGAFAYLNWFKLEGTGSNPMGTGNC